jgi:hypothetical protein
MQSSALDLCFLDSDFAGAACKQAARGKSFLESCEFLGSKFKSKFEPSSYALGLLSAQA